MTTETTVEQPAAPAPDAPAGPVQFEDIYWEAVEYIEKRRRGFDLANMDWEDVKQELLIHIAKRLPSYDPSKSFGHWVNVVVTNKLRNIWRDKYARYARPCVTGKGGCEHNIGGDLCTLTASGLQCAECPLFRKWEQTKGQAYGLAFASSLTVQGEGGELREIEPAVPPSKPFSAETTLDADALRRALYKLTKRERELVESLMCQEAALAHTTGPVSAAARAQGMSGSTFLYRLSLIRPKLRTLYNLELGLLTGMTSKNTTEFKIDADIPIPEPKRPPQRYPYACLQPGQSFFVPGRCKKNFGSNIYLAAKRLGFKFTLRDVTEQGKAGVRIWRLS